MPQTPLDLGDLDGRYRVQELLGSGSMGIVYRAEDIWLGRSVALKVIDPAHHADDQTKERFLKEAQALAKVRHDNVVQVYSFGASGGTLFFAMEYVAGENLDVVLEAQTAEGTTMELSRAVAITRAVAQGLGAVHEQSLVHRDVKPANILLEAGTGRPVLVDFGLARRKTASHAELSISGGTPQYMAPEQASDVDGTNVSPRSDIYGLGCTLFELLTGRPVFIGRDIYDMMLAHMREKAPLVSSIRPDLAVFDAPVSRALSKDPEHRQQTCAAFVEELDHATARAPKRRDTIRTPAPNAINVLVLETEPGLARKLSDAVEKSIPSAFVHQVSSADGLVLAFAQAPARVVLVDEDSSQMSVALLIDRIRRLPSGAATEVLVLARDWQSRPQRLATLGVRELPKPINRQVLASALTRIGERLAKI